MIGLGERNGNGRLRGIEWRLRIAAVLVLAGLVVEGASLTWSHPTAFLVFAIGSGGLVGVGVLSYLHSLVWRP